MTTSAVLTVDALDDLTIAPGQAIDLRLRVAVAADFHVQANPASDQFLVPLQLDIEPQNGLHAEVPSYPPGRPYRLQGTDSDLLIYDGSFEFGVSIVAAQSARPGAYTLPGQLRYQACDATSCRAPTAVPIEVHVRIVDASGQNA